MKLTREEFGKLSPADQENYRALHGDSFEHPLLNKAAGPAASAELKTEAFWHPREARSAGMQMMATPGREAEGRELLRVADRAGGVWILVALAVFIGLLWLFS